MYQMIYRQIRALELQLLEGQITTDNFHEGVATLKQERGTDMRVDH
jgi:hypothetical protein